jgi:hypothetical protein
MGGKPALANPQFPRDEVGGQAISQIRQGYESNMVNARAASAMGTAMQNVGTDIINTADNIGDGVSAYSRMANAEATAQFLNNLTDIQGSMKQQMAGANPSMYPVIVKNTYQTKDGQLNPALFQGISPFGRRFVEADAQRAVAKDMAEYSLAAHIANLDQDEGRKLASMQTLINGGQYDDAATMNESLFTTRRLSPEAYASNKIAIEGARDTKNLMAAIQANPVVMGEKLQKAIMSGTPLSDIKNISLESYPRYLKAAEYAHTFQTTEKVTAMVDLVDSNTMTLESLRANPVYKTLGNEERTALERRMINNKAGSTQSEMLIREGMNKLAGFPATDAPAREMLEMVTWATANIPDPHLKLILDGLQKRVAEMAENGGSLKPNSDIERYVANKLNLQASMGLFGQVPAKASGEEQSPEYVQQQMVIETAKMDALEKFRKAGITNQRDADEFLNQLLLPAQAKAALGAEPGVFQRAWRSMFPAEPPAKPTDPLPTRTPMPTPRQDASTPTGNEVSMFDPDVSDLTGGDYSFKVTDKTRDALPSSTPMARQVSLDFNDAASPTARGVEIIIPNDATEQERAIAKAYVDRTTEWFRSKGIDVPNRGVRTAKENGRGTRGRFHTEPFFVADSDALAAVQSDPDGYAKILASTLGRIDGMTFIAPHKTNDPGASRGGINERDFARQVLIPALQKLAT